MKLLETKTIGDVRASLYEEKYGYTFKIKARLKDGKLYEVGRSYAYYNDLGNARKKMLTDLYDITHQLDMLGRI